MIRIDRKEYLDFLVKSKDRQIIKVVSGVRRCGKSTLFEIYKDFLLENGVAKNQIISINFEDIEVVTVTVGRAKKVGPYTMMYGENPICIIKVVKK